ncbi:pentapeptide repeat-containing protein [Jatrophihabitans sp.]|uniref:pentapeptide repeat-containing protein n=1 Tax=Jatrophihabitans sp. TaxID=1932789 RepID=UPI0030C6E74D|nr:pentapeptide repeat-containing protein [Jatrophihabitans sp.]
MAELRADCEQCFALCCVGLAFTKSADFAADKAAGTPCTNLRDDLRCGVHSSLRQVGYSGCVGYDCFGAGQRVSQVTFGGRDWRSTPAIAGAMFAALPVMRQLHELLFYLGQARPLAGELTADIADLTAEIEAAASSDLSGVDVSALRAATDPLLLQISGRVRAGLGGRDRRGADLMAARLGEAELRGWDLRGAYLIGADLRGADLRQADLIGADLRDAHLARADLRDALFLSQAQLNSARGDAATRISPWLERPGHWR